MTSNEGQKDWTKFSIRSTWTNVERMVRILVAFQMKGSGGRGSYTALVCYKKIKARKVNILDQSSLYFRFLLYSFFSVNFDTVKSSSRSHLQTRVLLWLSKNLEERQGAKNHTLLDRVKDGFRCPSRRSDMPIRTESSQHSSESSPRLGISPEKKAVASPFYSSSGNYHTLAFFLDPWISTRFYWVHNNWRKYPAKLCVLSFILISKVSSLNRYQP